MFRVNVGCERNTKSRTQPWKKKKKQTTTQRLGPPFSLGYVAMVTEASLRPPLYGRLRWKTRDKCLSRSRRKINRFGPKMRHYSREAQLLGSVAKRRYSRLFPVTIYPSIEFTARPKPSKPHQTFVTVNICLNVYWIVLENIGDTKSFLFFFWHSFSVLQRLSGFRPLAFESKICENILSLYTARLFPTSLRLKSVPRQARRVPMQRWKTWWNICLETKTWAQKNRSEWKEMRFDVDGGRAQWGLLASPRGI